jgi:hypothetical protein
MDLFWPEYESKINVMVSFQTHVASYIHCHDRRAQSFRLQMCILAKLKQRIATQSSLIRLSRT